MNNPKQFVFPPAPPQKEPTALTEVEYLRQIAEHLKSIRSMLSFFTFILVLVIGLQVGAMFAPLLSP